LTIPNILSVLRILLAPVFFGLVAYRNMTWAFWVFFAGGLTDSLDGLLARLLDQKTKLGKTLDPVADKVFLSSSALCLGWYGIIPRWVVIVFVTRDILLVSGVVLLKLVDSPIPVEPHLLGKTTTGFQVFYIGFVVMHIAGVSFSALISPLEVGSVIFSFVSGGYYIFRGLSWVQKEKNGSNRSA
jgi:cardiolipin synthase